MTTDDEIITKYDLAGDGDLAIDVFKALSEARADQKAKDIEKLKEFKDKLNNIEMIIGFDAAITELERE